MNETLMNNNDVITSLEKLSEIGIDLEKKKKKKEINPSLSVIINQINKS